MHRLNNISKKIRKKIIYLSYKAKTAHLASSLSCVDLMVTIYEDFLKFNKKKISKNIFILSKGHTTMALYSILNYKKIISKNSKTMTEIIANCCKKKLLLLKRMKKSSTIECF